MRGSKTLLRCSGVSGRFGRFFGGTTSSKSCYSCPRRLTRLWIPLRTADMTADSGNGSLGFGPDFATLVISARIDWGELCSDLLTQ